MTLKRSSRTLLVLICLAATFTLTFPTELLRVDAQEAGRAPDPRLDEAIPPAALLTDRGRELAENLRNLRRTRANLGGKHPTLPVVERAIAETERQLRAWLPSEEGSDNPFKNLDSSPQRSSSAARNESEKSAINETDLRQLVLRLHAKIEQLEERVRLLENPKS